MQLRFGVTLAAELQNLLLNYKVMFEKRFCSSSHHKNDCTFIYLFIYFKQMTPLTSKSLQTNGNCSSPAGISASCSFAPID